MSEPSKLAKIIWTNPETGEDQEHVLVEGATATIGRASTNDIAVPDRHISRQHAVVTYRDGIFMISDLNSANGTFVNDVEITEPFPLFSGDVIRLFVPTLKFTAATEADSKIAEETGKLITASLNVGKGQLIITSGPQEGQTIPLVLDEITVGRAIASATWEIGLQDPSVSRPHAKLKQEDGKWKVYDLGSSNGTFVNDAQVIDEGRLLSDGDTVKFGATLLLYLAR